MNDRERVAVGIGKLLWFLSVSVVSVGLGLLFVVIARALPNVDPSWIALPTMAVGIIICLWLKRIIWGKGV